MHRIEEIEKALNLLDTYDGQLSKTARALGINRYSLRSNVLFNLILKIFLLFTNLFCN